MGMSALLGAQVPLRRAMQIMEEQGNPYMRERIRLAREEILRGRNMGEALRLIEMNFPDPRVAVDLEILSERGDIGAIIEQVTEEWTREQILNLKMQAGVIRNMGLAAVGGVIAYTMTSILQITTVITNMSKSGQGF
jgi:type II secretory pathway component PulF